MAARGINYDVGPRSGPFLSRPVFDPARTREDLWTIRDELHCDAVRISGTDRDRLLAATGCALELGLDVWLSGVDGAFVFTFSAPALPHRADPLRDLDLASYGVVRCYDDGRWEPGPRFHKLAEYHHRPPHPA